MTTRMVTFNSLPIWVQVWGLPFNLINNEVGWEIEKGLGQVIEVDSKVFTLDQALFIRVRVELLLDKPIRQGALVANLEGDRVRIGFKYERMVGLCNSCDFFGHEVKDCLRPRDLNCNDNPYREWLKARYQRREECMKKRPRSLLRHDHAEAEERSIRVPPQEVSSDVSDKDGNLDIQGIVP